MSGIVGSLSDLGVGIGTAPLSEAKGGNSPFGSPASIVVRRSYPVEKANLLGKKNIEDTTR